MRTHETVFVRVYRIFTTDVVEATIAGMWDRLAHGYFGIDYVIVWDVVGNRLIDLRDSIQTILVNIRLSRKKLTSSYWKSNLMCKKDRKSVV